MAVRETPNVIAWKVLALRMDMASVRYRSVYPALALRQMGYRSIFLQEGDRVFGYSKLAAFVFVKSFSRKDLELASTLHHKHIPIILDLCDDVFVDGYVSDPENGAFACFRQLCDLAAALVTPTAELANRLALMARADLPIVVIPDQLETESLAQQLSRLPIREYRDRVVPRQLAWLPDVVAPICVRAMRQAMVPVRILRDGLRKQTSSAAPDRVAVAQELSAPRYAKRHFYGAAAEKQVVWFGNQGAPHSDFGLSNLREIIPHLQEVDRRIPLKLLVVSNSKERFDKLFGDVGLRTSYKDWGLHSIFDDVRNSDVCILPNPRDRFSITKSANRAVLALSLGVPVVATSIPSMREVEGCVIFDDWIGGLSTYLSDPERSHRDVDAARSVIARRFSAAAIGRSWKSLLDAAAAGAVIGRGQIESSTADEWWSEDDAWPGFPSLLEKSDRRTNAIEGRRSGVSVAMCTFNGERFLMEQLLSIARQEVLPDELVISDDGSFDFTLDIADEFRRRAPFEVRILRNRKTLGIVSNFEHAVRHCRGDYIAFADQDDVWEKSRLGIALEAVTRAERSAPGKPILTHSDLSVIDEEGQLLDGSLFRRRGFRATHPNPLRELVLQNYVTGCTMMVNRPLVDITLPLPPEIFIHDWWFALVAAACGEVITIKEGTVRYRRHSFNAIGAKARGGRVFVQPRKARYQFQRALRHSRALETRLRQFSAGTPEQTSFLARYHELVTRGGIPAARALLAENIRYQNWLPTVALLAHVAAGTVQQGKETYT